VFDERRDRGVLDGDSVEGLEVMNKAEGLPILLEDTEPARVVSGSGGFVDTGGNLVFDDLYYLIPR
jgi:hypothetical protein